MSDKKHNRTATPPGGDRPLRRPAAKSGAPGKTHGKSGGGAYGKTAGKPSGASFGKGGGGAYGAETPGGKRTGKPKPFVDRTEGARGKPAFARPARAPAEKAEEKAFAGDRIAKVMARAGVCSRRDAELWIAEGRVAVNGRVLSSPAVNVAESDRIEIDGKPMQARERTRLFLFHKPVGLVTSARDPEGRETVFAYLDAQYPELPRLVSVGRLDINTEGLLLLTNDGGLARTLELPATGWTRRYRVRAHGEIDQARLDALKNGVVVEGVVYAPIDALLERVQGANAWIAMSLTEGKNREIKRVLAHLGLEVTRLIRVSYGPFQLGDLAEGAVEEVRLKILREQLGKNLAELAGVDFAAPARELTAAEREEMRQRADKRPRKHVSVLRQQRAEKAATGPRARIERGATADRKGRAVVVERVTPTRPRAAEATPATRNARRFESMKSGERPPRRERIAGENTETRQQRRPREDASTEMRKDMRRDASHRGGGRQERSRDEGSWRERNRAGQTPDRRSDRDGARQDWRRDDAGARQEKPRSAFGDRNRDRPLRGERSSFEERTQTRPPRRPREDASTDKHMDMRRGASTRGGDRQQRNRDEGTWRERNRTGQTPDRRGDRDGARREKPRGEFGDRQGERPSRPPGRSGGKPGGKFSGGRGGGPGARSGGGPGKGPRRDGPPRKPRER